MAKLISITGLSTPPLGENIPPNGKTIAILVTGTWSGTIQPQAQIGAQSGVDIEVYPSTAPTTPQATITANGLYFCPVAGLEQFLLVATAWSSGTANIYLNVGV